MPSWKKVIISGSDALLNTVQALSFTGSLFGTASFASTASYVNTLSQNVLITGSLTVGATTAGSNENTLILGPKSTQEGGQLLFQAGTSYTSASMLDVYQDSSNPFLRILRGSNAGSDAVVAQWNLHSKQMQLPAYNSVAAFSGTAVASLAVDSSGNILTVATGSGGGGSGTVNGGTAGYIAYYPTTGTTVDDTSGVYWDSTNSRLAVGNSSPSYKLDVTGDIRATTAIYANANNAMYLRGGDDAEFWDVNIVNTVGIYGQQDPTVASIKLGSGGGVVSGKSGNIGIATITPNSGSLHVNGNIFATSFTGSLFGTGSWAVSSSQAISSSYALSSSYSLTSTSASYALSASFSVSSSRAVSSSYALSASYAPSSTTINNNTNNYVITGTGTTGTLNGEANLTFDGTTLNVSGDATITGNTVTNIQFNNQVVNNYTLGAADASKLVEMDVSIANTVTVPTNASVGFAIGTQIMIVQQGTGQTTIAAAGGVTLRSAGSLLNLANQYSSCTVVKRGTDEWYVFGDLA